MKRVPLLLFLALLLLLGFLVGYFLWPSATQPPATDDIGSREDVMSQDELPPELQEQIRKAQEGPPQPQNGWCCQSVGTVCVSVDTTAACLNNGGAMFDQDQKRCNGICKYLSTL